MKRIIFKLLFITLNSFALFYEPLQQLVSMVFHQWMLLVIEVIILCSIIYQLFIFFFQRSINFNLSDLDVDPESELINRD